MAGVDALRHSEKVLQAIQAAIEAGGGWLSFADYMNLALYAPALGYYAAGAEKLGASGDFVTAPEISGYFGRAVARQAGQVLAEAGGNILELGAGTGRLALDILDGLHRSDQMPDRYFILEPSADLRARQKERLAREAPQWLSRVVWLDRLPDHFDGFILANEVLDALPVHLIVWHADGQMERGVTMHDGRLGWSDRPLPDGPLHQIVSTLPSQEEGYLSEINLAGPALVRTLSQCLGHGVMLFLDYGFPRAEYYHAQRRAGTLMCHYRHFAHDDPLYLPGLQDITAHVDFTAAADAALESGMSLLGYANQASFLISCGLLDDLARLDASSPEYPRAMSSIQKLLHPTEMGELFKAIAFGKAFGGALLGFARGDARHRL